MRDQIVMSPNNGQCAIAVPLFRFDMGLSTEPGYMIALTQNRPLAYVLDMDKEGCQVVSAHWAEEHLIFIGDL